MLLKVTVTTIMDVAMAIALQKLARMVHAMITELYAGNVVESCFLT